MRTCNTGLRVAHVGKYTSQRQVATTAYPQVSPESPNIQQDLPFPFDIAASFGHSDTCRPCQQLKVRSVDPQEHSHGKLSKDNARVEEAEEKPTQLRTTSLTDPQGRYCEHHANGDTFDGH